MELKTDLYRLLETSKPAFADDVLVYFHEAELRQQLNREAFHPSASVDLSQVAGCSQRDYANSTWLQLLGVQEGEPRCQLRRLKSRLDELARRPEYFLSHDPKSHWSFDRLDGKLYIAQGHHRTVIARFFLELNGLPPIVHGVTVTDLVHAKPAPAPEPAKKGFLGAVRDFFA